MKLEFQEYQARKVVNIHRHVDGPWFWGKYTAHPYIGCRSGCKFCYQRGGQYLGRRDPDSYDTLIRVKINAVELLHKELSRLPPDIIACGDWQQPAEDRYRLSRCMLEVVDELGFPLFIVERSPLLTRDLDLLVDINQRAGVVIAFSMSSLDPALKQAFEPRSPGVKRRLQAMEAIAKAGILVGATLMPVIPLVGDDERHLEEVVVGTREHGGSFVTAGGLTMQGFQAELTLETVSQLDPALESRWRKFYNWRIGAEPGSPPRAYNARLGLMVRELCARHGLLDRIPRLIMPGPLAVNKRIAERLFLKTYDLELEQAGDYRIWTYRKAAWTADELKENIAEVYNVRGENGLQELPAIGKILAAEIAQWLREEIDRKGEK
jgi:DNA repair photolyase